MTLFRFYTPDWLDPNPEPLVNVTNLSTITPKTSTKQSTSLTPNDSLQELGLYVVVFVLATIVLILMISVGILLIQIHRLRLQLRSLTEQALTGKNCVEDSTIKALDGTDYWSNFRWVGYIDLYI